MSDRGLVLLDRDGVINQLVPDPRTGTAESPLRPEDVELTGAAVSGIAELIAAGRQVAVVSNQPAAAKGTATVAELEAVNHRVLELLAAQDVGVDHVRMCLHHPDGVEPGLRGPCGCRKPAPGMLIAAAQTLGADLRGAWMIGDTDGDVVAGQAAGCQTVLVLNRSSIHKRSGEISATVQAPDLGAAVRMVLEPHQGGRA